MKFLKILWFYCSRYDPSHRSTGRSCRVQQIPPLEWIKHGISR